MSALGPAQTAGTLVQPIAEQRAKVQPRHAAFVRATHWLAAACLIALLVSGVEIVISHPRFYWGNSGNDLTAPLFKIPIPSSRGHVPTGYSFVMPDENGWSRALHFQSAWGLVFAGAVYLIAGFAGGHFKRNLVPKGRDLSPERLKTSVVQHLRFARPGREEVWSYNVLQRLAYLVVIFVMVPLMILTGLAMSPAFVSFLPVTEMMFGGRQSARTIHFLVTGGLVGFLLVHVLMVWHAGFWSRVKTMITGHVDESQEQL